MKYLLSKKFDLGLKSQLMMEIKDSLDHYIQYSNIKLSKCRDMQRSVSVHRLGSLPPERWRASVLSQVSQARINTACVHVMHNSFYTLKGVKQQLLQRTA